MSVYGRLLTKMATVHLNATPLQWNLAAPSVKRRDLFSTLLILLDLRLTMAN